MGDAVNFNICPTNNLLTLLNASKDSGRNSRVLLNAHIDNNGGIVVARSGRGKHLIKWLLSSAYRDRVRVGRRNFTQLLEDELFSSIKSRNSIISEGTGHGTKPADKLVTVTDEAVRHASKMIVKDLRDNIGNRRAFSESRLEIDAQFTSYNKIATDLPPKLISFGDSLWWLSKGHEAQAYAGDKFNTHEEISKRAHALNVSLKRKGGYSKETNLTPDYDAKDVVYKHPSHYRKEENKKILTTYSDPNKPVILRQKKGRTYKRSEKGHILQDPKLLSPEAAPMDARMSTADKKEVEKLRRACYAAWCVDYLNSLESVEKHNEVGIGRFGKTEDKIVPISVSDELFERNAPIEQQTEAMQEAFVVFANKCIENEDGNITVEFLANARAAAVARFYEVLDSSAEAAEKKIGEQQTPASAKAPPKLTLAQIRTKTNQKAAEKAKEEAQTTAQPEPVLSSEETRQIAPDQPESVPGPDEIEIGQTTPEHELSHEEVCRRTVEQAARRHLKMELDELDDELQTRIPSPADSSGKREPTSLEKNLVELQALRDKLAQDNYGDNYADDVDVDVDNYGYTDGDSDDYEFSDGDGDYEAPQYTPSSAVASKLEVKGRLSPQSDPMQASDSSNVASDGDYEASQYTPSSAVLSNLSDQVRLSPQSDPVQASHSSNVASDDDSVSQADPGASRTTPPTK